MVNILLVEDEQSVREATEAMLQKAGFGVKAVENGRDALDSLKEKSYDVIVLDLTMPVMNGMAFLKVRENDPGISKIPVVIISGHPPFLIPGVFDWIAKPFTAEELSAVVTKAILR